MEALDLLLNRASCARLAEPAPTAEQRDILFQAALRAPDHGQIRPLRLLTIEGEARHKLGALMAEAMERKGGDINPAAVEKARGNPLRAPMLVVVIGQVHDHPKVPHSEQLLTAGCAAHGILLAAQALGLGAIWRTGELSYDAHVEAGLGLQANESIIGFLYLGTPTSEPRQPARAALEDFVSAWEG